MKTLVKRIASRFKSEKQNEPVPGGNSLEELEEELIDADVGVEMTMMLMDKLRDKIKNENGQWIDVHDFLKKEMMAHLPEEAVYQRTPAFRVILVLGVNGSGKTTSIAKLAHKYKAEGQKVVLVAGDTFRAGAIDQLSTWAARIKVTLIKKEEGADPASVVYEGIDAAFSEKANVLIIDTAGRLHTKKNLMDELLKIKHIIENKANEAQLETLLILDGTTGNNGLQQARKFSEHIGITDLMIAKLDSSAKGGFVFSIAKELNLPVKYLGVGEKVEDLVSFSRKEFVEAIF